MKSIFSCADILIPKNVDMEAWSVVACDQHTSDKSYWQELTNFVEEKPSTLKLIVPEVYLKNDVDNLIEKANGNMVKLLNTDILQEYKDSIIYVERRLSNGKIRKGIIGKIDLENYSENILNNKKIKPSEEIVESRVPTRIKIRENASLDIPHILIFCNDKNLEIIENINKELTSEQKIYDFNLNMFGGQIKGFKLNDEQTKIVEDKINTLILEDEAGLIVADGNHSLVAAKRVYERVKQNNSNYLNSPKRYALVEIVNIYDESIDIEPIHRVIKNVDCNNLFEEIKKQLASSDKENKEIVKIIFGGKEFELSIKVDENKLIVKVIQQFLDEYLIKHNGEIDYIHELDKLKEMCNQKDVFGIVFEPISKSDVFKVISNKKLFPRKTFSIGTSLDKRYYLESRKLI